MWRKPNETKPSGQIQNAVAPVQAMSAVTQAAQPSPSVTPTPAQTITPPPEPIAALSKPVVNKAAAPAPSMAPRSTSVISAGLKIRGDISGDSDLHIEGDAQGKIRLVGGRVSVGPKGNVQADVEAREITVEGSLQGNLKASESVRLGPISRVQGSVITPRIMIEDGARLRGKVEMVRAGDSRSASVVAAATTVEPVANVPALRAATAGGEGATSHT